MSDSGHLHARGQSYRLIGIHAYSLKLHSYCARNRLQREYNTLLW